MNTQKMQLSEIALVNKGMYASSEEKRKPRDMSGRTEMVIINYKDVQQYNDVQSVTNTVIKSNLRKAPKVYLNLDKKFKDASVKNGDIIIPINSVSSGPLFIKYDTSMEYQNIIYHNKLIVIRPNEDKVIPEFLFYLLNTNNIKEYLLKNSWEENKQKHRLTCKVVSDIQLYIPSIQEQITMLKELEKANKIKQEITKNFDEWTKKLKSIDKV